MKIKHPLNRKDHLCPIQDVLIDLAAQEGCEGEPYDEMTQAADYIKFLELKISKMAKIINP